MKAAVGVTADEPEAETDSVEEDNGEVVEDAGVETGDDVISEAV